MKGDVITAKCLGVDEKGRVKMSRRAWLRDQKAAEAEAQQPVAAEEGVATLLSPLLSHHQTGVLTRAAGFLFSKWLPRLAADR